jgi:hypothetical protein
MSQYPGTTTEAELYGNAQERGGKNIGVWSDPKQTTRYVQVSMRCGTENCRFTDGLAEHMVESYLRRRGYRGPELAQHIGAKWHESAQDYISNAESEDAGVDA